jgi:dienelactone hydrolase
MTTMLARSLAAAVLLAGLMPAAGVKVLFNPALPEVGPFPTDALTVSDAAQKTGLRIKMPLPDCQAEPSTCAELALVNRLDGFSLQPRLRVRFSSPINPDTLRDGIFLVWLDDITDEEFGLQPFGHVTPINAVMYDPATNTAYAEPDEILSQHRRYALVVTDAVRDAKGDPVEPDPEFQACIARPGAYCDRLAGALGRVAIQIAPRRVAGGSVFTTLSATAWLEKARAAIQNAPLGVQLPKPRNVFAVADLAKIVLQGQTTTANPPAFTNITVAIPGDGADRVAFGSFRSPRFLNEQSLIPATATGASVALPAASEELVFTAWLPKPPAPASGYPTVIMGHGASNFHIQDSALVASTLAGRGFAVLCINAVSHGYGPQSKIILTDKAGAVTELTAGGRGVDVNRDGKLDIVDLLATPEPVLFRDLSLQTALDQMQLVRVIKAGLDLTGDGIPDLDRSRIYYLGKSLGSNIGTIIHAVEPDIRAAVLSDAGGSQMDVSRTAKSAVAVGLLSLRKPLLFNLPGPSFDAAYALRYQPVKIIDVPGAIALQEWAERMEWSQLPGDALAYAPHLYSSTLPGVPIRPVLFQMKFGDRSIPNPCGTNLVSAANLREATSLYRHDLALAIAPDLPKDPHSIFYYVPRPPLGQAVAQAGQEQIAEFFLSGGARIADVNYLVRPLAGKDLFEMPKWLPEDLNY